jgi:hypothetical protein
MNMTENEKKLITEFFELKARQLICKAWLMLNQKPGYLADELTLMTKVIEIQGKQEKIESDILELAKANAEFFKGVDLQALSREPEFKVPFERQKEFSNELLGYETTIEELLEKLQKRGY